MRTRGGVVGPPPARAVHALPPPHLCCALAVITHLLLAIKRATACSWLAATYAQSSMHLSASSLWLQQCSPCAEWCLHSLSHPACPIGSLCSRLRVGGGGAVGTYCDTVGWPLIAREGGAIDCWHCGLGPLVRWHAHAGWCDSALEITTEHYTNTNFPGARINCGIFGGRRGSALQGFVVHVPQPDCGPRPSARRTGCRCLPTPEAPALYGCLATKMHLSICISHCRMCNLQRGW